MEPEGVTIATRRRMARFLLDGQINERGIEPKRVEECQDGRLLVFWPDGKFEQFDWPDLSEGR